MKKIKRLCAFIFIFVTVLMLASCGGSSSGVKAEMTATPTRTKVIIDLWFSPNDNLKNGNANPHVKEYKVENNEEVYKSVDLAVEFKNQVYTSATLEFKNLDPESKYVFYLFVTYKGKDEKICKVEATTLATGASNEDATQIKTIEDFNSMADDPAAHYQLMNDIDFGGEEIPEMFTSTTSKQFTGSFDGNGYTLSNFTLKSSSSTANVGLFGYTNGATIEDLNLVNVTVDNSTTGKSSSNIGALLGTAENTLVKNVTITDVTLKIKGNAASTIMIGAVVGNAMSSDFENVNVSDVEITFTQARLKLYAGLFAGKISGNALSDDNVIVSNCSSEGAITLNAHYPGSEGYLICGGFVGNLSSIDKVVDSYTDCNILVTRSAETTANDYLLCVGGFIGANHTGSLNVNKCVAFADIEIYAGAKPVDDQPLEEEKDPANVVMTKQTVNVGGFIGKAYSFFDNITDCGYVKKTIDIKVVAKELNSDNEAYINLGDTVGINTDSDTKIVNLIKITNLEQINVFNEAIQNACKKYIQAQ